MVKIPDNLNSVLRIISNRLVGTTYAVRGTAGLVLQGLEFNVADIDIVCDEETSLKVNELLKDFLVEPITYKESEKFKSYFGKFLIDNIDVEIMGEWCIKDSKGNWSLPFDGSKRTLLNVGGFEIYVTTLESELSMFAYMQRWSVYHKIKKHLQTLENNDAIEDKVQLGMFN